MSRQGPWIALGLWWMAGGVVALGGAPGTDLYPLALLNRCYAHLTQKKLPLAHPARARVAAGESPIAVCLSVLDSASLQPAGADEGKLIQDGNESRAVLRAFHDLHRTWFSSDDFRSAIPEGDAITPRQGELHDATEPALHVTRALLTDGAKLSDVVTADSGMEALRSAGPVTNDKPAAGSKQLPFMTAVAAGDAAKESALATELVQRGELVGARYLKLNPLKHEAVAFAGQGNRNRPAFPQAIPVHRSLGGGLLGSRAYLMLNLGFPTVNSRADGGIRVAREWSKRVMGDLLCRDIPAVRIGDAAPFVQLKPQADTPPFRKLASCMSCHVTIDPLAGVVRNVQYVHVPRRRNRQQQEKEGAVSTQLYEWPVTEPREAGMVDADASFYKRPPFGRLFFRSYDGKLVNRTVHGVSDLGRVLSELDDFYVCAASRYFAYFTGVQVSLHDAGDPAFPPLGPEERHYRAEVVRLGQELKSHQSLKRLVRSILESPIYRSAALRAYGEVSAKEE